jgi:DNA-binding NarL/FixJ family response regulator
MSIKVAIVEDDPLVLKYLAQLLDSTEGFHCTSGHPNAENALKEIPLSHPDVVLMDINLPVMNGVECVRRLREKLPETPVVMLTAFENTNIVLSALASGACGYLLKRSSSEQIITAIRDAFNGESPMSSAIARKLVGLFQQAAAPVGGYNKLSMREQQVIDYLAKGWTYNEIAVKLEVSYATVHTHIKHIYKKLQVGSRTGATALHLRHIAVHSARSTRCLATDNLI